MKDIMQDIKWEIKYIYKEYIRLPILEVKWFIQRGRRGWADSDVYDIGNYLSDIIPDMVKHQITYGCGYPVGMTNEEWDKVRAEIASGFMAWRLAQEGTWFDEDATSEKNQKNCVKAWKGAQKSLEKSCKLLAKHFGNLWD